MPSPEGPILPYRSRGDDSKQPKPNKPEGTLVVMIILGVAIIMIGLGISGIRDHDKLFGSFLCLGTGVALLVALAFPLFKRDLH